MRRKKDIAKAKNIVLERIDILMNLADQEFKKGNKDRVKKYIQLSKKLAMKMRIPFPKKWKRRICKNCGSLLIYGTNSAIRINSKNCCVNILCFECNNIYKIPYIKEKKLKRKLKNNMVKK
ncbi:RNAse P, Rpr2/Rpp21 subunit [Methanococcus aeolicus Nankai-3]|uniref:Ribonuclease P protein component 4 n=1 Tax=Methanococcus aeolicus (strain ATCC BAA-1280 / DSM 17508 / OCM 812 / Nankai-3) TaxID=419665 RepID=A6UUT3_META3|nr:ribonuclease P [Methanococcus aeolicus]ABR56255.1 RNAse P, Rpr2/Rpp21 subunit [Methanococcus aeolicus Nankai-3]